MALNWGAAGSGAVSGASTGAAFGPWGVAGGALLGAASGLFSNVGAKNDALKKNARLSPQQEELENSILKRALGMQQGGGYDLADQYYNNILGPNRPQAFENFSAPYMTQFQEEILPQIAERYAGAGALSSSGFGQAVGGAASGLQAKLAQLFSQLQSEAASQQYNQFNQSASLGLNTDPFLYTRNKGTMGFGGTFATGISQNMEGILAGIQSLFKKNPAATAKQGIT
jgi:hypothetical protein